MLTLKKIDYYLQCILSILMLLSMPFFFFFGFLAGLFLLGFWQLASAILNTNSFLHAGHTRLIINYWRYTGMVMALLFLCVPLSAIFNPDDVQGIGGIAIVAAVPVSWYYLSIYLKLIKTLELRHEVSGLIKSKH
jgi:hypothetical protein